MESEEWSGRCESCDSIFALGARCIFLRKPDNFKDQEEEC